MKTKILLIGLVFLLFNVVLVNADLTDGLVSYYKFDSGTSDSVGTNDLTNNGATSTTGLISNGYDFVLSEGDNMLFPSGMLGDTTWTVTGWFKADITDSNYYIIGRSEGIIVGIQTDYFYFRTYGGGWVDISTPFTDTTGYHFFVASYDKSTSTMKLYLDGSFVGSATQPSINNVATSLYLGKYSDTLPRNFDGVIDEIGVYNRLLSDTEILQLYNNGNGFSYPFVTQNNLTIYCYDNNHINLVDNCYVNISSHGTYSTTNGFIVTDILLNDTPSYFDFSFYNLSDSSGVKYYNRAYSNLSLDNSNFSYTTSLFSSNPSPLLLSSPADNDYVNVDPTFSGDISSYDAYNIDSCSLYDNRTGSWELRATTTPVAGVITFSNTGINTDGKYIWNIYCVDSYGNNITHESNYTYIADFILPYISFSYPYEDNSTAIDTNLSYNLLVNDTNNYKVWVNVTNPLGTNIYSKEWDVTGTPEASLTDTIINSVAGYYIINVTAADGHTKKKIRDYRVKKLKGHLEFVDDLDDEKNVNKKTTKVKNAKKVSSVKKKKSNKIEIHAEKESLFDLPSIRKKKDRYEFSFKRKIKKSNKNLPDVFIVNSSADIEVVKDSKYKGHLIVKDGSIYDWKWVDFETKEDYPVFVSRVNKNKVKVYVYGNGTYNFNSIGNLNVQTKLVKYYYNGSALVLRPVYSPVIVNNISSDFSLNMSIDPLVYTINDDASAILHLNGTDFSTSLISYNSTSATFKGSGESYTSQLNTNIYHNWTVNISQVNGTYKTKLSNTSQQKLYKVSIATCNASTDIKFPILNLTYSDESSGISLTVEDIGYGLNFYDGYYTYNANDLLSNSSYTSICTNLDPLDLTYNFETTGSITLSSTGYVSRTYNFVEGNDFISSNNPFYTLPLNLLSGGNSTKVIFNWYTTEYQAIDGLLDIKLCNPNGSYSNVGTINIVNGIAVSNINIVDSQYSYSVVIDGVRYEDAGFSKCHIESSTNPTYYVDVSNTNPLPVVGLATIDCTLTKVNDSVVRMSWGSNIYDPTTSIKGCIEGYVSSAVGVKKIYESCENTSGIYTFERSIPNDGNSYIVSGVVYQDNNKGYCQNSISFYEDLSGGDLFDLEGLLGGIFLILSMALFYAGNGETSVYGAIAGLLAVYFLGISNISWLVVSSLIFFAFIIVMIARYNQR